MPSHPISCNTIFKVCVNDEVVHAIKVLTSVSIRSNLFFLLFSQHLLFFFFFLFFVVGCWVLPLPFISHCNKPITRTPCALNQNFYFLFHFSPYREASNTFQTGKEEREGFFLLGKRDTRNSTTDICVWFQCFGSSGI